MCPDTGVTYVPGPDPPQVSSFQLAPPPPEIVVREVKMLRRSATRFANNTRRRRPPVNMKIFDTPLGPVALAAILALTLGANAVRPTTAARPGAPLQCAGCEATVIPTPGAPSDPNGYDADTCPGTGYYVSVTVEPKSGTCTTTSPPDPEDPCTASGCEFVITMRWNLPSGEAVDLCHVYDGNRFCVDPAPTADGTDEEFAPYNLPANCDGIVHRLDAGGTAPCGDLSASVFATCSECED